jgi:broad specificity phosphatase PhoE
MKKNYCTIYLVRHGRTDWNQKGLIQGHSDIELDPEGKVQALGLAKELKNIKFDKVYSSDLLRAKQTADIIAFEHKLAVEARNVLRERRFGVFEGKHWTILKKMENEIIHLDQEARFSYKHDPSVESDEEVMARFLTFLREIAITNPGKKILIVTHGGPMRILLSKLKAIKDNIYFLEISNLAYIKLESDGVDFFVKETKGIENKKRQK